MDVSLESVPRKGLLSKKVSSLPSVQSSYIPVSYLVSWWPRKNGGNLEFGSNQDGVGKGCQKSGCGGCSDCRVVVIYSVVNCKVEGVRRDSVVLGCEV
jgi:hypothetical protein